MVVDDAPICLPTLHSMIYSVVPFPKKRDVGELSCDCFTFLTPTSPVDQVEKESDSVDEVQTSATKVRDAISLDYLKIHWCSRWSFSKV